jgi:hypothetical protein
MKNLALALAILVTGVINAQSFNRHKDLLAQTTGDTSFIKKNLFSRGFTLLSSNDSIRVKFIKLNETALLFSNECTGEMVKVSEYAVEYIYDEDKYVIVKNNGKTTKKENLYLYMTKRISGGWNDNIFARIRSILPEDTYDGRGAYIITKFKKLYIERFEELENEDMNSLVIIK